MKDLTILRMVVLIIGIILIMAVGGIIYLVSQERAIPSTLETIVALGIGGLLGLLAPSKEATSTDV